MQQPIQSKKQGNKKQWWWRLGREGLDKIGKKGDGRQYRRGPCKIGSWEPSPNNTPKFNSEMHR